ncbi:C4-dicarboxylic acid transporter DauA [Paenibacillus sp. CECT 9249]|uniref:SulP family inorganic anion transporter n=1 Tax=Paenibacillus sp. CECT 9249 TaxID=2845385 RepID=UPI001E31608E|nr:SulP family inorganic anion transporter [Paenibacillus sp. CECT 9249]CAH0122474.1 C4-dicarboxylic acid transporter DauA [Paenibacillus sp. CECT 9249]
MMRFVRAHRFRNYSLALLWKDLLSGLIVGIIALPLGMAFAIASGVDPQYGIYTTIIAGILISVFGGSRHQIGGPTGAFVPVIFGIVTLYGFEDLLIAGFMAGMMLLLMGLLKMGAFIKYIPRPVTIGFTAGIAVIIFTGQIANFLGLQGIQKHERFIDNMAEIVRHVGTTDPAAVLIAAISLLFIIVTPKLFPKLPGSFVALIVAGGAAALFFPDKIATIGSTYGAIPSSLPTFRLPNITWDKVQSLFVPALTIALLGGVESLLSAVVADGMTGDRHHSNRELIGQGIANLAAPLFGGIPATGAIARTATNIKNGAQSPVSGIVHGFVTLLILLLFAPYASAIPLAAMAPVLMTVAWNMSEVRRFKYIVRLKTGDTLVLLVTFLLTVFVDLITGVGAGLLLAFVLFVKKMSSISVTTKTGEHFAEDRQERICYAEVEGVLFFGAAQSFERLILDQLRDRPSIVVIRLKQVPFIDTTGISFLSGVIGFVQSYGGTVLISEVQPQLREMFMRTELDKMIGETNMFAQTGQAVRYADSLFHRGKTDVCG